MSKNLEMPVLFDFYGKILTEKQRITLEMYYNSDLSLGEISDEIKITRQGVLNCIKSSEAKLVELEEKLGLAKRLNKLEEDINELTMYTNNIVDQEIRNEIQLKISDIMKNI